VACRLNDARFSLLDDTYGIASEAQTFASSSLLRLATKHTSFMLASGCSKKQSEYFRFVFRVLDFSRNLHPIGIVKDRTV